MKVLITGVNGFIGKNICQTLCSKNEYEVIGIGRGSKRTEGNFKYIESDISANNFIEKIESSLQQVDIIIHTAACLDKNDFNKNLIDINCKGTSNIAQLAIKLNAKKVIYTSSLPVIGIPKDIPITENHLTNPITMYHSTKLMGEYILMLLKKHNIVPIILRIPSPIGKGMNLKTILSVFIQNCKENKDIVLYGKGKRVQNYIDVRDICISIEKCIQKDVQGIFNIASEKSYSNLELANICIKNLSSSRKIIFNNIPDPEEDNKWIISVEKAKKQLDFLPQYSIEDSIKAISESL